MHVFYPWGWILQEYMCNFSGNCCRRQRERKGSKQAGRQRRGKRAETKRTRIRSRAFQSTASYYYYYIQNNPFPSENPYRGDRMSCQITSTVVCLHKTLSHTHAITQVQIHKPIPSIHAVNPYRVCSMSEKREEQKKICLIVVRIPHSHRNAISPFRHIRTISLHHIQLLITAQKHWFLVSLFSGHIVRMSSLLFFFPFYLDGKEQFKLYQVSERQRGRESAHASISERGKELQSEIELRERLALCVSILMGSANRSISPTTFPVLNELLIRRGNMHLYRIDSVFVREKCIKRAHCGHM